MRIENLLCWYECTQLTLSIASPVNEGEKITSMGPHKTLSKGNELLALLLHAAFFFLHAGYA